MNYFELYQINTTFKIDKNKLKNKFYELSKKYHPDFYINESIEKQNEILELSTINNKAYQTLSNIEKLIPYILQLKSIITPNENFKLPQEFLIEMMDINEALMELSFEQDVDKKNQIKSNIQQKQNELDNQMKQLFEEFELENQIKSNEILQKIKLIFYKLKYINNLKNKL